MGDRALGITRAELDAYSIESHRRAQRATESGWFAVDLVPLEGLTRGGRAVAVRRDEGIRSVIDPAFVAGLRPSFHTDGALTAANSSQLSDGAAAVLIAERSAAETAGLRPRARVVAAAVAADDPRLQFTAVLPSTRLALERAGLGIEDIHLAEVNEAFAPIPLLWQREFDFPADRLNVNGGSIAIGHPLGSTGTRLITQLVGELERRGDRFGLLTICEGGGMANTTIIERLD